MKDSWPGPADNLVFLRGVLAAPPQTRTLPSGDELCSFRLTVPRPRSVAGRARVDSIDCATTLAAARRAAGRCQPGVVLEVIGSLRRRFWRSATGAPASRYEVDVVRIRRAKATAEAPP